MASKTAAASPDQCKPPIQDFTCETLSENSITIARLIKPQKSIFATEFDTLPTIMLYSDNPDELRSELSQKNYITPYHLHLPLPWAEAITSIEPLPQTAIEPLKLPGWELTNTLSFTYENNSGDFIITCMTLEKFTKQKNIAILQCNEFYPNDIDKLKALAKEIERQ